MKKIAIILRKPPYGDINAAEAVRHALGAVSDELEVALVMFDGGVHTGRKNQNAEGTEVTNLGAVIKDCIDMGVSVYAEKASLRNEVLDEKDVIEGIKVVNGTELAGIIKEADSTLIF